MPDVTGGDAEHAPLLDLLEQSAFTYFQYEVNEVNGLVRDNTDAAAPASIAGTGFALSSYPVAVQRGHMPREEAVHRTRTALRFLWEAEQSDAPDATGAHGFFYHFLDMQSGRRVWQCELSTIDSAIALAGVLTSGIYFDRDTEAEQE
ncbi:MAG: glucoamylase family protein, partial [Gemmatimonadaceae bacterium]